MEKIVIYKNKGETFKCHFNIDGASTKDTTVRLCLEFDGNPNYFFHGTLKENGECVIEVPRLKNLDEKQGHLTIEAIADSIYFKVYEANVEFKNSVEVSMQTPTVRKVPTTKVKLEQLSQIERPKTEVVQEQAPEPAEPEEKKEEWKPFEAKPFRYQAPPQQEVVEEEEEQEEEEVVAPSKKEPFKLRSFRDYTQNRAK